MKNIRKGIIQEILNRIVSVLAINPEIMSAKEIKGILIPEIVKYSDGNLLLINSFLKFDIAEKVIKLFWEVSLGIGRGLLDKATLESIKTLSDYNEARGFVFNVVTVLDLDFTPEEIKKVAALINLIIVKIRREENGRKS